MKAAGDKDSAFGDRMKVAADKDSAFGDRTKTVDKDSAFERMMKAAGICRSDCLNAEKMAMRARDRFAISKKMDRGGGSVFKSGERLKGWANQIIGAHARKERIKINSGSAERR